VQSYQRGVPGSVAAAAVKEKQKSYEGLRGARLEVMVHEQYGRLNEEAVELVKQLAHRETALRLGLGAGEREANPLYGATFGAVLANFAQAPGFTSDEEAPIAHSGSRIRHSPSPHASGACARHYPASRPAWVTVPQIL